MTTMTMNGSAMEKHKTAVGIWLPAANDDDRLVWPPTLVDIPAANDGTIDYKQIQKLVGGLITTVGGWVEGPHDLWCHDEALLVDKPLLNLSATYYVRHYLALESMPVIMGSAVILRVTKDGDSIGIDPESDPVWKWLSRQWQRLLQQYPSFRTDPAQPPDGIGIHN